MKGILKKCFKKLGFKVSKLQPKDHKFFETQVNLSNLNKRQIIFDVGAFDGMTSINYHKYFGGNCEIYAFEPFKDSFELMTKNTEGYKNVKRFNVALGDKDGDSNFYVNKFAPTNSLLPASAEGLEMWPNEILVNKEKIKVPIITLDTFMTQHNIDQIDILKLDAQGAEYLILEGAKNAIKDGKIKIIFSELIVMPSYEGQKNLDEVLQLYRNYGFELHSLFKSEGRNYRLKFMDGIFIYKEKK